MKNILIFILGALVFSTTLFGASIQAKNVTHIPNVVSFVTFNLNFVNNTDNTIKLSMIDPYAENIVGFSDSNARVKKEITLPPHSYLSHTLTWRLQALESTVSSGFSIDGNNATNAPMFYLTFSSYNKNMSSDKSSNKLWYHIAHSDNKLYSHGNYSLKIEGSTIQISQNTTTSLQGHHHK